MKVRTRKLAVFVTCLGLAAAFPVLSSADKGGVPHNNKPCPGKGKGRSHKKPHKDNKGLNKGKKCGFAPITTTVAPTTAGPIGPSGTQTDTQTTTTTTSSTTTGI